LSLFIGGENGINVLGPQFTLRIGVSHEPRMENELKTNYVNSRKRFIVSRFDSERKNQSTRSLGVTVKYRTSRLLPEVKETMRRGYRIGDRIPMAKYAIVSLATGVLFGIMDGLINANPIAESVYAFYGPIRRTSVNVLAGVLIDLYYGFVLAGTFILLFRSLPGRRGWVKGVSFALLVWFFRVVMHTASEWMILEVPVVASLYSLVTGLAEMLVLGSLYGLTLKPLIQSASANG